MSITKQYKGHLAGWQTDRDYWPTLAKLVIPDGRYDEPMIRFSGGLDGMGPEDFSAFCDGWSSKPSPERFFQALQGSRHVILAKDGEKVVGFINAISDGELFAFIPMLEVVAEYRSQGIASELVRLMVDKCGNLYGIDLLCDANLVPFYERFGMQEVSGMCLRNRGQLEH